MKTLIKILSVAGIISLICMLFTGCDYIDQLRAQHAVLSEDMQKIEFEGKTYLRLPDGSFPYVSTNYDIVNTTEHDVPVLLSNSYRYFTYSDPLRGLLKVEMAIADDVKVDYYGYLHDTNEYVYYCIEEKYDEYMDILSNNEADRIGFYDYGELYYTAVLSSGTSKEINDYIMNPDGMSDKMYEEAVNDVYDWIDVMYRCDKSILLREDLFNYAMVINTNREVYLVNHTTCTGAKLSAEASEEITNKFFDYGSGNYFLTSD